MTEQKPTIGRIVHYRLSDKDVESIKHARMMANQHQGNDPFEGDVCAALIVRVVDDLRISLQVFLDGPDVYWATSRGYSAETGGCWFWPPRV